MADIDKVRLNALTIKFLLDTLTEKERQELEDILQAGTVGDPHFRQRFNQRVDSARLKHDLEAYLEADRRRSAPGWPSQEDRRMSAPGRPSQGDRPVRRIGSYWPYAVAAAVIGIIALVWLARRSGRETIPQSDPVIAMEHEIKPGGNRATLTLGNGTVIDLDSAGKGVISRQGAANVLKTADGRITYQADKATKGASLYNTISTPRKGTYQVTLPDGSRAWLNAESSIRFPAAFSADRRELEMTGEVYLDIAQDPRRPFYVKSGGIDVQVLGTEFDIQNYKNEPSARVTLVNGAVKVQLHSQSRILSAGQQAQLTAETAISVIDRPDIDQATAWKSGFFKFKNADIRSIMREIERWYDVDVDYHMHDFSATYGGRIRRDLPLSQLLRLLQGNNIHHYKMEGRKLIVLQ